jgi:dTDP-4-dehydrorhamnose 3,5-epimerase
MRFLSTPLEGAYLIEPHLFTDERGWFLRYYCKDEFREIGHSKEWVQCNHSHTHLKGTLRGMHFQRPPFEEIKLVRCIAGAVYDVIIDLRDGSPTFLKWFGIELSATNRRMLYIPEGFAHGFQVLTDNSELLYHHTAIYTPGSEGGIRYDDPVVGIGWPLEVTVLSGRDSQHTFLNDNFKGI